MNDMRDYNEDFSLERQRRAGSASARETGEAASTATAPNNPSSAEVTDSAFPDRIRRKYYVVASESEKVGSNREARLYADERGEYLAFKSTDDRLVTRIAAAEVIRDMVSVAQHRQWEALDMRGSVEFRREAWLEARARGMDVKGYQATELDGQALADRRAAWDRAHARTKEALSASDRSPQTDRLDYDKGVSGRLMEVGFGPYRNRADAEPSTYVAIELDDGRRHQVWGVGVVTDVADSGARPGDRISLRRDGVEPVIRAIKSIDAATGIAGIERRQMWRNMWKVTVEERRADRPEAGHDSDLLAAQSQIAVIKKLVERALPNDEHARLSIMAFAKERVAQHLENGNSFARATVIEPVRDRHEQSVRAKAEPLQTQSGERIRLREQER